MLVQSVFRFSFQATAARWLVLVDLGHLEDLFECTWWVLIHCQWSNQMLQTFVFWCCAFITLIVNQGLTLPQDPAVIGPDPLGMFGCSFWAWLQLYKHRLVSSWILHVSPEGGRAAEWSHTEVGPSYWGRRHCANSQTVHKFGHKSDVWRCTYFVRIQPSLPLLAWARQAVTPKLQHEHWRGDLIILIHSWKSK